LVALIADAKERRKEGLSPSAARKEAIRTGAHTPDWNGDYQIPITKEEELLVRADRALVEPLESLLKWVEEHGLPDVDLLRQIIEARHWQIRYFTQSDAICAVTRWWPAFEKEFAYETEAARRRWRAAQAKAQKL
jgi:hypothetical protein